MRKRSTDCLLWLRSGWHRRSCGRSKRRRWKFISSTWKAGNPRCSFRPAGNPCWSIQAGRGARFRAHRQRSEAGRRQPNRLPGADPLSWRPCRRRGRSCETDPDQKFCGSWAARGRDVECSAKLRRLSHGARRGQHIQVKPGDKLPVSGLDVQVISAAAETISKPLPGAGADESGLHEFRCRRTK